MTPKTPAIDPDASPIFVIGTGRSGTTLLRMMLNAHPRIYLTHEASFYLSDATQRRLDGRAWLEHYFHSANFAWLRLDPDEIRRQLPAELPRREVAKAFSAIMRAKAARYDRPRFGDKTPMHSAYLKRIFRDYPDPRVVHIVRDPRGTVASLLRMPWAASTPGLNSIYCRRQMAEVRPFADRVHELRLEDLIADPEPVMRKVLAFVGEPWDDAVLAHADHGPQDDVPPFPWFQAARRPPKPREGGPLWLRQLEPAWIRRIEAMNRKEMRRLGYEPAELDPEPTWRDRWRVERASFAEATRCVKRLKRVAQLAKAAPPPHPQDALDALFALNPEAWTRYPDFVPPECPPVPGIEWSARIGGGPRDR